MARDDDGSGVILKNDVHRDLYSLWLQLMSGVLGLVDVGLDNAQFPQFSATSLLDLRYNVLCMEHIDKRVLICRGRVNIDGINILSLFSVNC